MRRFPSVRTLARSSIDDVMAHWAGLGYYTRARNLHRSAQIIDTEHQGHFPETVEDLMDLPGIGRSTAGAILSLSLEIPTPILDGNVKRVLARHFAVPGWPGTGAVLKTLWEFSSKVTPQKNCKAFNQGMMDLGATICTRSSPNCESCPLNQTCQALKSQTIDLYPGKKPKRAVPQKETVFLIKRDQENRQLLMEKRPETGIWSGLWSFPEFDDLNAAQHYLSQHYPHSVGSEQTLDPIDHTFSHFKLKIQPLVVDVRPKLKVQEEAKAWLSVPDALEKGIASPIKRLLESLDENQRV